MAREALHLSVSRWGCADHLNPENLMEAAYLEASERTAPPNLKMLLPADEAAESLSICPKTLWNHTEPRGTIPCVRIGTRVLYDPLDLRAWIDGQKRCAA